MSKIIEYGEAIKDLRSQAGLSRVKFAKKINVNPHTLRGWENGILPPEYIRSDILKRASALVRTLTADIAESVPYDILLKVVYRNCSSEMYERILEDLNKEMINV